MIKGGKLLTREQTVRLAIASSADRKRVLQVIIAEMREAEKAREAEKKREKGRASSPPKLANMSLQEMLTCTLVKCYPRDMPERACNGKRRSGLRKLKPFDSIAQHHPADINRGDISCSQQRRQPGAEHLSGSCEC